MSIMKVAVFVASAAFLSVTTSAAFAHDADGCVLEKTFECLDDADFWDCYDFILADCQSHDLPHSRADLNKFKAKSRQQAVHILEQHTAAQKR